MEQCYMNMKILLPYGIFLSLNGIRRIVAESYHGSFGLLPHRLDCTVSLSPGILIYENQDGKEFYVAVDEGILVKAGKEVFISVRNAITGTELGYMHTEVEKEFKNLNQQEKSVRSVMAKLEMGFIRKFEELRKI